MGKRRIAPEKEVLALFTAIMRGEITDYAVRKVAGGEELIPVPPKVSDRSHAAELLAKRYGLFTDRGEQMQPKSALAEEIQALARQLSREVSP